MSKEFDPIILIVDDDLIIRKAIKSALTIRGLSSKIMFAETAAEARLIVRDNEVVLALVDRVLPDGDGIELISELSQISPDTISVLFTATLTDELNKRAIEAGAVDCLSKDAVTADGMSQVIYVLLKLNKAQTDQRQAIGRLETTRGHLDTLLARAPVTLIVTDYLGRIMSIEGAGFIEIKEHDVLSKHISKVFVNSPDLSAAITQAVDGAEVGLTVRRKNKVFSVRVGPWLDEKLGPGAMAVLMDITEQYGVEQRLSSVLNAMFDALVVCSADASIQMVNDATESLFSLRGTELIGKPISKLMVINHPAYLRTPSLLLEEANGQVGEWMGRRGTGELFPMEASISSFDDGVGGGYVVLMRDVTERRELDRMKAEFVSTVSHELRTPVTSILGSLRLVAAGALGKIPEEANELIDIAVRNGERLTKLLNDILEIERLELGRISLSLRNADLLRLAEDAINANRGFCEQHEVRLALEGKQEPMAFFGDPTRIGQVYANLISNAAKFSPKGSEILIRVSNVEGGVRAEVIDRGPGIADEFSQRIFGKFQQADSSDTRKFGGTGLGLAISKAIVEQHGGTIGFRNREDGGCIFWFEIPGMLDFLEAMNDN